MTLGTRTASRYSILEADSTPGTWTCRMLRKNSPVTRPGIDPGTFRLVAQRLNHYAIRFVGIKQNNIPDIMNFEVHFYHSFHLNFETKRDMKLIKGTRTVCSTLNYNINEWEQC